jgi:hypothetical protein
MKGNPSGNERNWKMYDMNPIEPIIEGNGGIEGAGLGIQREGWN